MDGAELRAARAAAGLTLQELAHASHMALSTIQKYERDGVPPGARERAIRAALASTDTPRVTSEGREPDPCAPPRNVLEVPVPDSLRGAPEDVLQTWRYRVLSEAFAAAVVIAEQGTPTRRLRQR